MALTKTGSEGVTFLGIANGKLGRLCLNLLLPLRSFMLCLLKNARLNLLMLPALRCRSSG